jgi:hypothetical protein
MLRAMERLLASCAQHASPYDWDAPDTPPRDYTAHAKRCRDSLTKKAFEGAMAFSESARSLEESSLLISRTGRQAEGTLRFRIYFEPTSFYRDPSDPQSYQNTYNAPVLLEIMGANPPLRYTSQHDNRGDYLYMGWHSAHAVLLDDVKKARITKVTRNSLELSFTASDTLTAARGDRVRITFNLER